ncbi:hypothetical protein SAMN05428959_1112 [Duganella sp. CF517]|uniref:hypothetical protein n=1 Tax=Duganella sp. CF517 TaxID=1881038 RepID=UPI0008B2D5B5|nr:hypothetical protein [Duganella sp. CF517]SEO59646.1 hypothetical protein SAMN05428959_1112 [Duganella sp. CF517]
MSQGFVDDVVEFFKDLILGDFEQDQGKAAMIVGGAISLIPVVDQIMDVRDVSGMIYRVGRKGVARADKDDWIDMALAAFGCIPEVGSLFKTIVKPIRKYRKEAGAAAAGGNVMIEAMLGKGKGAAIKFMKTFQWAQNTELAIQTAMGALDNCVALLTILSTPHWWLPTDLQHLARDLKPQVERVRGPLKVGIAQGAQALQDMIKDMLGEDALWVAKKVATAATVVGNPAAKRDHRTGAAHPHSATPHPSSTRSARSGSTTTTAKAKETTSPGKGKEHKPVADSSRQSTDGGSAPVKHTQRPIRQLLSKLEFGPKGLIGEHMADYYHMEHVLGKAGAWPHGNIHGQWRSNYPRIVGPNNKDERPSELVPEDLAKVRVHGVDTIWQTNENTYHFIEAKFSENAYSLHYRLQKNIKNGSIPEPPATLNDREQLLWSLLAEPKKGTQMGKGWIVASTKTTSMQSISNLKNRWVYLMFALPSTTNPFANAVHVSTMKLSVAPGAGDHLAAMFELISSNDYYNIEIHNKHKGTHGISETFHYAEIDRIAKARTNVKLKSNNTASQEKALEAKKPSPVKKRKI